MRPKATLSYPTSAPLGEVFRARQDLRVLDERLRLARAALAPNLKVVEQDRQMIEDNILQGGWLLGL
jgi:hypothetical protein